MSRWLLASVLLLSPLTLSAQELNVKQAVPAWSLPWDDDWVTAVTFAGPKRFLVAGNEKGGILVWELPDKAGGTAPLPVRSLEGHTNGITRLITTPDGRTVISASKDKTIRIWDLAKESTKTGEVVLDPRKRESLAKKAPAGKEPKPAPGVMVKVQEAEKVLTEHKEWILGLDLSQDGKTLLSGDDAGQLVVWDREAGKVLKRWSVKGWVHGMALSPDAKLAVVTEQVPLIFDSGRYTAFKVWDVAKGEMVKDLTTVVKENLGSAAFSPDGKHFAVGRGGETGDGKVYVFQTDGLKKLRDIPAHNGAVHDIRFSSDSKLVLSSGRDTTVRAFGVADGKQVAQLGTPRGGQFKDIIFASAISSDQKWIAGADQSGQVQVWHIAGGTSTAATK